MEADRRSRGWSYSDLAEEMGVAVSTVTRFFNGQFQTPNTAKKIALALGHPTVRYVRDAETEAVAS